MGTLAIARACDFFSGIPSENAWKLEYPEVSALPRAYIDPGKIVEMSTPVLRYHFRTIFAPASEPKCFCGAKTAPPPQHSFQVRAISAPAI